MRSYDRIPPGDYVLLSSTLDQLECNTKICAYISQCIIVRDLYVSYIALI